MRYLKDVLCLTCLLLLAYILFALALHIKPWAQQVDAVMISAKTASTKLAEAADTSNMVSTQTLDLVGSSTKLVDHATKTVDQLNKTAYNVQQLTTHTDQAVSQVSLEAQGTLRDLDQRIDQVSASMVVDLDALPPVFAEAQTSFKSATVTLNNLDGVLKPSALMVTDWQMKTHEWLYPANQSKWRKTLKFVRTVAPLVQPSYYGLRIIKGD